ncbi:MAG: biotin/lipoyl-binding protein [Vicinamibacterales bacterium]
MTARRRATVSSKVTGKIVEVNVEEGMAVREGQVLARLDDVSVRWSWHGPARGSTAVDSRNRGPAVEAELTLGRRERLQADGLVTDADLTSTPKSTCRAPCWRRRARSLPWPSAGGAAADGADNTRSRAPLLAVSRILQGRTAWRDGVSLCRRGGGFTRTGDLHHRGHAVLEIRGDVTANESYINRVSDGQPAESAVLDAFVPTGPSPRTTTVPMADRQKATVLGHRVRGASTCGSRLGHGHQGHVPA